LGFGVPDTVVQGGGGHLPKRVQEVDIYLKFTGKFDVSISELMPEKLAEQGEAAEKTGKAVGILKAFPQKEEAGSSP